VTRYEKCMKKTPNKRGRPKKADAKSAAERMRAYRKRKRDAGLANVGRWEPADGLPAGHYSDHRIRNRHGRPALIASQDHSPHLSTHRKTIVPQSLSACRQAEPGIVSEKGTDFRFGGSQ